MFTDEMIAALRCPLCHSALRRPLCNSAQWHGFKCDSGHSFDVAKSGYVHLGTGKKLPEGDTAAMVEARAAFLAKGHFAPIEEALTQEGLVADLGAGPGHYLKHGLAFDVSKPALRRAAKKHGAVLADTWGELPLKDASIDVLLNIFAPRNGPEMRRVLKPDGMLIVVTPEPDHLIELREELGLLSVDESKQERLAATLQDFDLVSDELLRWRMDLGAQDAQRLVQMGPNAFHGFPAPGESTVSASVRISRWKGRPLPTHPADRDAHR